MPETLVVHPPLAVAPFLEHEQGASPSMDTRRLDPAEFARFVQFACAQGIVPDGLNLWRKDFAVWAGLGELRDRVGPHLYVRARDSRAAGEATDLLALGRVIQESYPEAEVVVEPRFANLPLAYFREEPLESIRNIKFRVLDQGQEVFRADLRQGNRSHFSALRVFAFDGEFELAHRVAEHFLRRRLSFADLDCDVAAAFLNRDQDREFANSFGRASAPQIDFNSDWLGHYSYPYTLTQLTPTRTDQTLQGLDRLVHRSYQHALAYRDSNLIGAQNDDGVAILHSYGSRLLRGVQHFIDDSISLLSGSAERHPLNHLWIGLKCPEITPRTFMAQAIAMENRNPAMRFELREMQPLLRLDEFRQLVAHPEIIFKSVDRDLFHNRTVIALNGVDGFFVQFNPMAGSAVAELGEEPTFFSDRAGAQAALESCHVIIGRTHPNLPERWRLLGLLPGVIDEQESIFRLAREFLCPQSVPSMVDQLEAMGSATAARFQGLLSKMNLR